MKTFAGFMIKCAGISLLGFLPIWNSSLCSRGADCSGTADVTSHNFSAREENGTAELFSRMAVRHVWQESHLVRLAGERTYSVVNGKHRVVAEEVATVKYSAPGAETFTTNSAKGSRFVRNHVFLRLLNAEVKRLRANSDPDSLITPENYNLQTVGMDKIGGSDCLVVHAVPKRKAIDLFEGKIWIDNHDSAIVKITGRLSKSPSFWIKRVDFVRDYREINGFWLLSKEEVVSVVRIFGKETLTINYEKYVVNGLEADQALVSVTQQR